MSEGWQCNVVWTLHILGVTPRKLVPDPMAFACRGQEVSQGLPVRM
jgi:hypothetical protein